jgi:hypothetical protein
MKQLIYVPIGIGVAVGLTLALGAADDGMRAHGAIFLLASALAAIYAGQKNDAVAIFHAVPRRIVISFQCLFRC